MADVVQYKLEHMVNDLDDLEKRGLFTRQGITEIVKQLREKGNKKMKKRVSDFTGVLRILDVYRLAVTRFKGDVELWSQYLEFCKQMRKGRMEKRC